MNFSDRMKTIIDQGLVASKELAAKAGAKAQDIGERSVLMFEIKQLESQVQRLVAQLGAEAFQAFSERGEESLCKESAVVKSLLSELAAVKESIERKDAELSIRKNKP